MRTALILSSVVAIASASSAAAPPKNLVAAHPLVIAGPDKRDAELFQALFKSALLRMGLELVDDSSVQAFLARQPHHSCAGSNDCLAQLASTVNAPVVFAFIHRYPNRVELSARLVDVNGKVVKSFRNKQTAMKPKQKPTVALRQSFRKYLPSLVAGLHPTAPKVARPEPLELAPIAPATPAPAPPREATPPVKAEIPEPGPSLKPTPLPPPPLVSTSPVPTMVQQEVGGGLSTQQIWGIVSASAGVALAVGGGIFEAQASKSWSDFDAYYRGGLPPPDQVGRLKSISDRAKSQQTVGAAMLIGGGALLGGGVYLFLTGRDDGAKKPGVSAAVGISPKQVSMRLKF